LPVRIRGEADFNLLAVWAKPYGSPRLSDYINSLLLGLLAYGDFIRSAPTVVVGDFNSSPCFGPLHWAVTSPLTNTLRMASAYHYYFKEFEGEETQPTYYHRAKKAKPFHIDYCFLPREWASRIERVSVGSKELWYDLSDHMPIIVDIEGN